MLKVNFPNPGEGSASLPVSLVKLLGHRGAPVVSAPVASPSSSDAPAEVELPRALPVRPQLLIGQEVWRRGPGRKQQTTQRDD